MSASYEAADILAQLHAAGFTASVHGDQITLKPKSRTTPELIEAVRINKPALLAALHPPVPRGYSGLRRTHLIERSNGRRFWSVASRGTAPDAILGRVCATIDSGAQLNQQSEVRTDA